MKKTSLIQDIGFGNKGSRDTGSLIDEDGRYNVIRKGRISYNFYAKFLEMGWKEFYVRILSFYIIANFIFAYIFAILGPGAINGIKEIAFWPRYLHCFFFSIQTFTTVGYGNMSPNSIPANILSSLVAFIGLMILAVITGMLFARLSKPIAHVLYSDSLIIAPFKDGNGLMFRMANSRNTVIADLKITVILTWLLKTDGQEKREYRLLNLERDAVTLFALNWTIVHPLDEDSPIYGLKDSELKERNAEIMIDLKGHNETFNQMVRSRKSYKLYEVKKGVKFAPMYYTNPEGRIILELDKIDELIKIDA